MSPRSSTLDGVVSTAACATGGQGMLCKTSPVRAMQLQPSAKSCIKVLYVVCLGAASSAVLKLRGNLLRCEV